MDINNRNNLFIPGGLFLGMGLGMIMGNTVAGLFIGLGTGFVLSTLLYLLGSKSKEQK